MGTRRLDEGWTVAATAGPAPAELDGRRVPAAVPGCVSTDLIAAGVLPDPYVGTNEALHSWVGRCDWSYETSFEAPAPAPGERADLVFLGLDTVATVRLNGKVLGSTANMHRSYRFDARSALVEGQNVLAVDLKGPIPEAERRSEELGPRPHTNVHPFNAIRKMACNFGWDWGPDLATAGIWRPVLLEYWRVARIAAVRPWVRVDLAGAAGAPAGGTASAGPAGLPTGPAGAAGPSAGPSAGEAPYADASAPRRAPVRVELHIELERATPADAGPLRLEAEVAGQVVVAEVAGGESSVVLALDIPEAELWWPAGYGGQPLYPARARLRLPAGDLLSTWEARLGFRSVELDTAADARGSRLGFVVNGRAVQVRGANWIPEDCFPSRIDRDWYRRRLEDARAAHVNLLRVWGGGIYESEDFYQLADEYGLMVWQDFMLACAAYAEEEPLRSEIEAEAREAITRLSSHASVAAWSGSNENLWGHEDWGWEPQLQGRTWGSGYYFELFPALLAELDPTRPYMAGSPWSFGHEAHPNDPRYGSVHVWDVWNQKDYTAYRDWQPRFVAEFGWQGPPTWPTLARALEGQFDKASEALAVHEKQTDGIEKLDRWVASHFPAPASFDDWLWATSLNQARAVSCAVEYWRSLTPRCRGTILWQLNDCWPVFSWAAVDGDGRRKPLWYALRRVYADRLLTVQPGDVAPGLGTALAAVAVNDSPGPWRLDLKVTRLDFSGAVLAKSGASVDAAPGESVAVALDREVATAGDPAREVLVVAGGGHRALWFYGEDKDLALPAPALSARVEPVPGGYEVVVEAATLQRDVALFPERVDPDATCDDMVFTLLPGESRRVRVDCPRELQPAQLSAPGVLRSANQLAQAATV